VSSTLARVEGQLREVERERESAYAGLREQVSAMAVSSEKLQGETKQLVNALRAPQVRGRWGELQLERVVQLAGMVEHCDFSTQVTGRGEDGGVRPDMVVHLAGGKQVVVDAKVPFAAYLEAVESRDAAPTASGSPRTRASCASTSTRWPPRATGRRSSRPRSSSCCSCRATRSSRPPCRPTRR
jgi:DNA anti-recombination protein RmuC